MRNGGGVAFRPPFSNLVFFSRDLDLKRDEGRGRKNGRIEGRRERRKKGRKEGRKEGRMENPGGLSPRKGRAKMKGNEVLFLIQTGFEKEIENERKNEDEAKNYQKWEERFGQVKNN